MNKNNRYYKNISKVFICRYNTSFLHILKSPKVLPCGNTVCEDCIRESCKNGVFKCGFEKCKEKHEIKNIDSLIKNVMVEDVLNDNLVLIADHIISKIKKRFSSFKESLSDKKVLVEKTFEFMEDEINIRIESIRIELDSLQISLIEECKALKSNILEKLNNDYKQAENEFENYTKVLSKHESGYEMNKLKENIYACQTFVKEIQNFDLNFSNSLKKCSFRPSDWIPDKFMIGNFRQNAHINFDAKKVSNLEIFNFENQIKSINRIFNLNNKSLLVTSSDDNTIVQLDDKYNEIKKINYIQNHKLLTPLSVCSDGFDTIYICDFGNNCVVVTDNEFSRLKRIIGRKSLDCGQSIEPLDICFADNTLYVLNKDNSVVTTFNRNGDFERHFLLRASLKPENISDNNSNSDAEIILNRPNRIGANNKIFAVLDSFRKVYLYDCINGELNQVIKSNNSTMMCLVDDYLLTCNRDGHLNCYQNNNNNNKFVQTFERPVEVLKDSKSYMCIFNEKILVTLTDTKSIVAL